MDHDNLDHITAFTINKNKVNDFISGTFLFFKSEIADTKPNFT